MQDTKDIPPKENNSSSTPEINKEISTPEENIKEKPSESENKMEENSNGNNGRWGKAEHLRFLAGCLLYKNNWKKVETYVRTRTSTQIRSHAQKYLKKLEKKYFSKDSKTKSANDSNDDLFEYNETPKENKDKNNNSEKNNNNEINNKNNNNKNEIKEKKENKDIEEIKTATMKLKEITDNDEIKFKLSEEKIKNLVDNLNNENYDIEAVEKIIINIFRPNKKCEDYAKTEQKKVTQKFTNTHFKTSKNIFLCQKQKREINYESKIKEALNSNNQIDLQNLIKIYKQKCSPEYEILLYLIENN